MCMCDMSVYMNTHVQLCVLYAYMCSHTVAWLCGMCIAVHSYYRRTYIWNTELSCECCQHWLNMRCLETHVLHVFLAICVYVCMYIYIYIHVSMYIYIYTCV